MKTPQEIQNETNEALDLELTDLKKRLESLGVAKAVAKKNSKQSDDVVFLTKKLPRIIEFFDSVRKALGDNLKAFMQIPVIGANEGAVALSAGFGVLGGALLAINFVRIPMLYLSAFISGEKIPFTLKNNVKFAFAGIALALFIVAVAFPPSAPFIGAIGAGFGFVSSVFGLAKVSIKGIVLRVQLNKLGKELEGLEQEKASLLEEKNQLLSSLDKVKTGESNSLSITQKINDLEKRYNDLEQKINEKKEAQATKQKSLNKIGFLKILDKCMAIGLSALGLTGIIVSFFYPPVGLGILGGTAAVGAVYLTLRLAVPPIVNYVKKHFAAKAAAQNEETTNTETHDNSYSKVIEKSLEGTDVKKMPKLEDKQLSEETSPTVPEAAATSDHPSVTPTKSLVVDDGNSYTNIPKFP